MVLVLGRQRVLGRGHLRHTGAVLPTVIRLVALVGAATFLGLAAKMGWVKKRRPDDYVPPPPRVWLGVVLITVANIGGLAQRLHQGAPLSVWVILLAVGYVVCVSAIGPLGRLRG